MPDAQVEANVLKALAGAPDLANQAITTTTVYGVVTLSGSVQTEALRTEAETIASRTAGVQKVVDEMTLSGEVAENVIFGVEVTDGRLAPAVAKPSTRARQDPSGQRRRRRGELASRSARRAEGSRRLT